MKARSFIAALLLLTGGASMGLLAQERMKPKGPPDFGTLHAGIKTHFDAKHYGQAYGKAKELVELVGGHHAKAIREAIPNAPGYTKVLPTASNKAQNAMLAGMSFGLGNIIQQEFKGGPGQVKATVTADSPMVQMFSMLATNPALIKEGQELIKYEQGVAMVETNNNRVTFQMVVDKSFVECTYQKHDVDYVLGMWSQDAVNALAMTLEH